MNDQKIIAKLIHYYVYDFDFQQECQNLLANHKSVMLMATKFYDQYIAIYFSDLKCISILEIAYFFIGLSATEEEKKYPREAYISAGTEAANQSILHPYLSRKTLNGFKKC